MTAVVIGSTSIEAPCTPICECYWMSRSSGGGSGSVNVLTSNSLTLTGLPNGYTYTMSIIAFQIISPVKEYIVALPVFFGK